MGKVDTPRRRINSLHRHGFKVHVTSHCARRVGYRFNVSYEDTFKMMNAALVGNDRLMIEPAAQVSDEFLHRYYVGLSDRPKFWTWLINSNRIMYINHFFWCGKEIKIVMSVVLEQQIINKVIHKTANILTAWRHLQGEMPDLYWRKEDSDGFYVYEDGYAGDGRTVSGDSAL